MTKNSVGKSMNTQSKRFSATFMIGVMVLLTLFSMSFASATFDWDPFGYWNMDSNIASVGGDLVDNEGNPTHQSSLCKIGSCANLSLNNNFKLTSANSNFGQVINSTTINLWVYPTQAGGDMLMQRTVEIALEIIAENTLRESVFGNGNADLGVFPFGAWTMVTMTKNASNVCLYANGGSIACVPGKQRASTGDLFIGVNSAAGGDFSGLIDELAFWNRTLNSTEIAQLYNSGAGLGFGLGNLVTTLNFPTSHTNTTSNTIVFNVSSVANTGTLVNVTLYVDGIRNETIAITGVSNETIFTKTMGLGKYNWTAETCSDFVDCNTAPNRTLTIASLVSSDLIFNESTFETSSETFKINITTNGSALTAPRLWYNGTYYSATSTDTGGNNYVLSKKIQIPLGNGTSIWKWNFKVGGAQFNTTTRTQSVDNIYFNFCNSTITTKFLNLTFKDEGDNSVINATIPTSTFVYWLGEGSINKSYTYVNNTIDFSIPFCFSPTYKTLNVQPNLQYKTVGYPQRIWAPGTIQLTNSTLNQTLYLLATADGQYVTFQVVNSAEQVLEGINVNATTSIGGVDTLVASGVTSAAGSVTFWLNPDFVHDFVFAGGGYTTYPTSFAPTQTSYTITLGATVTSISADFYQGISFDINPKNTTLTNRTVYVFNFTLASTYWDVTEFGFVLSNSSGSVLGTATELTNGGTASLSLNTQNNSQIIMNYYWIAGGNYTNGTKQWYISDSPLNKFSILHFFEDVKRYMGTGMFGIDNFGLAILMFLVIFVSTGIMSFKYGFVSPAAISVFVFTLVLFFDVGLGMMVTPINAVPHFITVLTGIIMVGVLFREVYR